LYLIIYYHFLVAHPDIFSWLRHWQHHHAGAAAVTGAQQQIVMNNYQGCS
jgi:hypothetical protein